MSAFEEYSRNSQRLVAPGSIEDYLAMRNAAGRIVEPVASDAPVVSLGADGVTDWLKQNWILVALGGVAVFALASA